MQSGGTQFLTITRKSILKILNRNLVKITKDTGLFIVPEYGKSMKISKPKRKIYLTLLTYNRERSRIEGEPNKRNAYKVATRMSRTSNRTYRSKRVKSN